MTALVISIILWLVGVLIIMLGYVAVGKLKGVGHDLLRHAEHEKGKDNSASIVMAIQGKIIDVFPVYMINIFTAIIGIVLIALGFVAVAFTFR
ncbi:hypothetical protein QS257_04100 [Terrilactibacillus sp. S3-3]|nr:hypothetical protein QS257_04100 [Terrilactibacillus sp. S3-3]